MDGITTDELDRYVEENTMRNWYDEQVENVERWLDGKEVLNRLN